MSETVTCIRCEKEMQNIMGDKTHQPVDGLAFRTYGHYGSTYFDPMNGDALILSICDECVEDAESRGRVKRYLTGKEEGALWRDLDAGIGDGDLEPYAPQNAALAIARKGG